MSKKHSFYEGIWVLESLDGSKEELVNTLVDEGEKTLIDVFFRDASLPGGFYVHLTNTSLSESSSLVDLLQGAPTMGAYAAIAVERSDVGFPIMEQHEGDYRVVSKRITFEADGGNMGPFKCAYLATTSNDTGVVICGVNFLPKIVLDGDGFSLYFRIKLK